MCPGQVWGFSSDIPNFENLFDNSTGSLYDIRSDPFDGIGPGTPPIGSSVSYGIKAAKAPTSFPYPTCDGDPVMSSADPASDEQWSAGLANFLSLGALQRDGGHDTEDLKPTNCHYVWWSRAIAVGGEQTHVTYGVTGWWTGNPPLGEGVESGPTPTGLSQAGDPDGRLLLRHDLVRVNIADPTDVITYSTAFLGHKYTELVNSSYDPASPPDGVDLPANEMEYQYFFLGLVGITGPRPNINTLAGGTENQFFNQTYCAQTHYVGLKYYCRVTYSPDQCLVDGTGRWMAARLELHDETPERPTCYCSDAYVGQDNAGKYVIALFSVRAFMESEGDEPWAAAIKVEDNPNFGVDGDTRTKLTTGLATGKAINNRTRTTSHALLGGSSHLVWDGTLQDGSDGYTNEIVNKIIDAADPEHPANLAYPSEDWNDLRLRAYVRVYGKDYAIFTTTPYNPGAGPPVDTPTADFEDNNLNHGLPAGVQFKTGGSVEGNHWEVNSDGIAPPSEGVTTAINGSYQAANTNQLDPSDGDSWLSLPFTAVTAGDITVKYRFANRLIGTHDGTFSSITNSPNVNNTGEFLLDGVVQKVVDNSTFIIASEYTTTYTFTFSAVPAGEHTIKFRAIRRDPYDELVFQVDDIAFGMPLLVGDDYNNVNCYIFDGERVRKAKYRVWPLRDEENAIDISDRASTVPDFILPDKQGRILYCNSHYVARVLVNDIDNDVYPDGKLDTTFFDRGFAKFTASPTTPPPAQYQDQNCEWRDATPAELVYDAIADPKWGAPQMMWAGDDIQLRGMNGSLRDATVDALGLSNFQGDKISAGTLSSGGVSSVKLDPLTASPVDGAYLNKFLFTTEGQGKDQSACIVGYQGAGHGADSYKAVLKPEFRTLTNTTSKYEVRTRPEDFIPYLSVASGTGAWNKRVHGWTLKNDDAKIPHLEIIWHCTKDQPAFPVKPPYTNAEGESGPWPVDGSMTADSSVLETLTPGPFLKFSDLYTQIHDPTEFSLKDTGDPNTKKSVWSNLSKIVSRVYGDSFSRRPQFHWARPHSAYYPDPAWAEGDPQPEGPYPSIEWRLLWSHQCPSAGHDTDSRMGHSNVNHCHNHTGPNTIANPDDTDDWHYTWDDTGFSNALTRTGGLSDFDAVDEGCGCVDNNFDGVRKLYQVELEAAYVLKVYTTTVEGLYIEGDSIPIYVVFNKPVSVTEHPRLLLNLDAGGYAEYSAGSGTQELQFLYVVGAPDFSTRLDYTSSGALVPGPDNGRITTVDCRKPAVLTLPEPESFHDMLFSADLTVE
jgi:hypothetical protein